LTCRGVGNSVRNMSTGAADALVALVILLAMIVYEQRQNRDDAERRARRAKEPAMICPHCQAKGTVTTRPVTLKRGVSGAKVTAALITFGASILLAGLSQKRPATEATCSNCGAAWHYE
jgi:hypothetical protein